ncbi:aminoacyl--tRNA ligase-related protein [Wukongibacter sp. M2B1]|uniref:aminoacyl--tRNA ligase-related protein n=1 Tax=Wukongibacter sp. M2B1 TaxID=3088895 RepID=UPI003D79BF69
MCFTDSYIENGYVSFYEDSSKIITALDGYFRNWVIEAGGVEYRIPALIDKKVLDKCGYFNSFPQHLTVAAYVKPECYENVVKEGEISKDYIDAEEKYLTPAACLHIYPMLEGKNIDGSMDITTLARVYRYEQGKFNGLTRLWDFSVRELVFVGTEDYVLGRLEEIKKKSANFAKQLGIDASIITANDHFYPTKENRVKAKIQRANTLKFELSVPIQDNEVSVASFNFHGNHFSKPFNFENHGKIVTGCVGFGLERWIAAIKEYKVETDSVLNNI